MGFRDFPIPIIHFSKKKIAKTYAQREKARLVLPFHIEDFPTTKWVYAYTAIDTQDRCKILQKIVQLST
jgi:hypothetical protein